MATGPNQVWSWDITKLHGPAKWTYYYLYAILDIYSRYAVGWMVATRESATLAEKLIAATAAKQHISHGQLTVHADRGSSMTGPGSPAASARSRLPGSTARRSSLVQHTAPALGPGPAHRRRLHHGTAGAVQAARARVLTTAYHQHPERFGDKPPRPQPCQPPPGSTHREGSPPLSNDPAPAPHTS
jgi:putative transposase